MKLQDCEPNLFRTLFVQKRISLRGLTKDAPATPHTQLFLSINTTSEFRTLKYAQNSTHFRDGCNGNRSPHLKIVKTPSSTGLGKLFTIYEVPLKFTSYKEM